jgi:hypothetical protein
MFDRTECLVHSRQFGQLELVDPRSNRPDDFAIALPIRLGFFANRPAPWGIRSFTLNDSYSRIHKLPSVFVCLGDE